MEALTVPPVARRSSTIKTQNIRKLAIPAVNFGGFGKDAHKWTERVNVPYTFELLPKLIQKTIDHYLK